MPSLTPYIFPSGGALLLDISAVGASTLERSTDGATWTTLYSNSDEDEFLDTGDDLPGPLSPTGTYYYRLTDTSGTVTIGPYAPAGTMYVAPDITGSSLVRLLRAALDSASLPETVRKATVMHALPLSGFPQLPIIVVNDEMEQQEKIGMGANIPDPDQTDQTTPILMMRYYRISAMCATVDERTYYKGFIGTVLSTAMSVYNKTGSLTYHLQSNQTQLSRNEKRPAFYMTETLLQVLTEWGGGYTPVNDTINSIFATMVDGPVAIDVEAK